MGFNLPLETRNGELRKVEMMMDNLTKMFNCPEIQDGWEPKVGDWTDKGLIYGIIGIGTVDFIYRIAIDNTTVTSFKKEELIYLPGIRQLMGMVEKESHFYNLLIAFGSWIRGAAGGGYHVETVKYCQSFDSPQELWLAFVMHELHGKKWSGERWI